MKARARRLDPRLAEELRRRLLDARTNLLRTVAVTDEEVAGLDVAGPGDSTDRATAASIAALVSRVAGQDKRELDEIAEALRRLGSGAYGVCESCRKPIAITRLRAVPATRFCLACQEAAEVVS
ncbi:MAG TPA: TraR/DksA family transcriptional regulator [Methylomirabilota bacterium]|nr:TraR/DksA family transcriptional regulator [Methylomirabilota bacterium]